MAPGTGTSSIRSGKPGNRRTGGFATSVIQPARSISIHFEVKELGGPLVEQQRDLPGRAVAMLGDVDLGDALLLAVFVVIIVAVDEHHKICVLFNRTRLAKIRQDRDL